MSDQGWNSTTLSLYLHCGTHMDAPKHFLGEDGATIVRQRLATCLGPARVVDLTPVEPRELITVDPGKRVALIGVEAPSVADVNDLAEMTEVHQTLFRGGVVIVEGLINLNQLRQPIADFVALPLRVTDGDGSPVRAIAIEDSTESPLFQTTVATSD